MILGMAKQKKTKTEKEKEPPKPQEEAVRLPEEKSLDFGGLPERDLKKSLGCG